MFGGLSKLIGLATVAISVPITLRYLGNERYGMWMTISSMAALMAFADMGIGNGLVSALAAASGKRPTDSMVRLISSAFFMLAGVAALVAAIFCICYPFVSWGRIFGVAAPEAVAESGPSVMAFVLCFAFGLPFTVVQRTQLALQESWRANIWQSVASVISLVGVVVAAERRAQVAWLVLAMGGGAALTNALNTFVEFAVRRPGLRPGWRMYDPQTVRGLLRAGSIFVMLQICVLVSTESDQIIIAQVFGAAAVGPYSVTYRLYQTSLIFSLFLYPLWPALGESLAQNDYVWVQRALRRASFASVAVGTMLAIVLLVFGRAIIHAWVGDKIVPDGALLAAFAACIVMTAHGGVMTAMLNNARFLRIQLKWYGLASLVAFGIKLPMVHWLGPSGVVWATFAAFSLFYCLPAHFIIKRYLHNAVKAMG